MADIDVVLQTVISSVLIPFFLTFVALSLFQDQIKLFHKRLYAYVLNKSIKSFNKKLGTKKQKLFAELSDFLRDKENYGSVLEIGAGGGANFQFYPEGCTVTCLEYNEYFKGYLEDSVQKNSHFNYNGLIVGDARNMQVKSSKFHLIKGTTACLLDSIYLSLLYIYLPKSQMSSSPPYISLRALILKNEENIGIAIPGKWSFVMKSHEIRRISH